MVQVLVACGRDVDHDLPWIEPWFVRYQMADGGLSCDEAAYRQPGECPSSMVGTVAPLEAMLLGRPADWTTDRRAFVDRAAGFLVGRRLVHGSQTRHNAEERDREAAWRRPCFPRFYAYDVVRGLCALVRWAEVRERSIPLPAIALVIDRLIAAFPDGIVQLHRRCYDGVGTWAQSPTGGWARRAQAFGSALLNATSAIGQPCPATTAQWAAVRQAIVQLIDGARITPA